MFLERKAIWWVFPSQKTMYFEQAAIKHKGIQKHKYRGLLDSSLKTSAQYAAKVKKANGM